MTDANDVTQSEGLYGDSTSFATCADSEPPLLLFCPAVIWSWLYGERSL